MDEAMNDMLGVEKGEKSLFTVERAAWMGVVLLAAGLRLYQLGLRPAGEGEAVQAMAAYRFTQGAAHTAPAGTIPALFTGNVAGFTLVGANDIAMRWLPALAGLILVLLPYGLRHRLGRGGALAASLMLAISPSAVYFSRTLDGAIVVAACGLALAVGLVHYLDTRRPGALYFSAVSLGLGLTAGPGTFSLLLIFAAFALLLNLLERLLDFETGWSSLLVAWWALRSEKRLGARTGAVLAGTFGLAATAFVLYPAGLGHAADLLGTWAVSFLPEPGGQHIIYPSLLLLRYEGLIVLFGLAEIAWAAYSGRKTPRHERTAAQGDEKSGRRLSGRQWTARPGSSFPHSAFLAFWAAAAYLIVVISGHRPPGNILLVIVPLALLAGQGIERACRWLTARSLWAEAGATAAVALGLCIFLYLQLVSYAIADTVTTVTFAGVTFPANLSYLILAVVALVLLLGLALLSWFWRGPESLAGGVWLALLAILSLVGFKAMWTLNSSHGGDPLELMIGRATAPDVRAFVDHLEELSLAKASDARTLPFTVDSATGPVVAWYLRDFHEQIVVEGVSEPPDTVAAVTLAVQDPPMGETFRGTSYPLQHHWLPWGLRGQKFLRWLLFTADGPPVVDKEIVLWVASQP
jgi:uncharacterized protein (TIGR03663 family)